MNYSYVALDVETANSFRGSICSIGLVKFQNGKVVDSFYSLINPEEDFDYRNINIHGITQKDILNCQIKLDFSSNSEKLGMVFDNSKTS